MTARSLFDDGRLHDALEAQRQHLLDHPEDDAGRLFLIELHLFLGQIDDAAEHLSRFRVETDEMRDFISAYRDLLEAERARQSENEPEIPSWLEPVPKSLQLRRKALQAYRKNRIERCVELLDESLEAAPELTGHIDGREFEEVRNTDDLLSGVLEAFVESSYVWVPFESIRKLRLAEIDSPRDHLFRPGILTLKSEQVLEVHLPTVYAGTWKSPDDEFRLGRDTDWSSETDGLVRGVGAQLLWFGEEELTLHDFRVLEIRNR